MAEKLFKGFKQVVKADYDAAVSNGTAIGYLWFVRPDASVTNEGDIYFGTRHYGHFGENDLASVTTTITNILASVGLPIDGEFQGFTGATLTNAKTIVQGVETLATLIDTLSAQIDAKVASISASDNSIVVDNTDSTNPKIKVQISNTEGNTLEVKENGLYVNVPTEVPYTGSDAITVTDHAIALKIADTDKVLSQDENGLIANVSLVQDSTDSLHYILKGKDETVLGEINLPKDQFLKSAEFIASATEDDKAIDASVIVGDPYLKFVFQTDGSDKTTYVSVKDLVDTYTAGNGISVSAGNIISIDESIVATKTDLESKVDKVAGSRLMTDAEGTKLAGIEDNAQVNKIESVSVNGIAATIADKAASVTVQGKDIAVGTDIKEGEDIVYAGTTKLDVVLQNMQDSIQTAVSGGLTGVVAGDGINVSNVVANKQTITAKLSTDESNLLKLGSDKGLFVAIYYDGDDAE